MTILNVLAHGYLYEHGFAKKYDGHKLCAKSCAKSIFNHFSRIVSEFQNTGHSQHISPGEVIRARFHEKTQWSSIFRTPSRNLKVIDIPNILAHGKSYGHGFTKKHDGHKLCKETRAKSSFDQFFAHR
ncbi:hypothetical protein GW17_00054855 [Ensete ventricosum]|nr:hypothetical protein GW17_00054855 [Ensete ventricosum]RZR87112.1 hypothetical protein BHM03_00014428 [Ensete ventricosum]